MKHVLFGVVGLFLASFSIGIENVSAATTITSSITSDTTWTASSSPYIIAEALTISSGATLTLEPGVVVKLQTKGIAVNGTLRALGTESQKVYFTAQSDDSVGGDSNNNGGATTPAVGAWQGIQVHAGGAADLEHTVVRYAGATVPAIRIPKISSIHNNGGTVQIKDSEFSHSSTCAVGQAAGSVTITRMHAHVLTCGVVALGGGVVLADSIIKNTDTGLFVNGATSLELTGNIFEQNVHTADINIAPLTSFVHNNNIAAGSSRAGLLLRGSLLGNMTLTNDTMPYILTGEGGSRAAGGFTLITDGNLTVASGATLTLASGVAMKFESTARLIVSGTLDAQGTQTDKVYFTSVKDDAVSSDTNSDGSSSLPAKGDWVHIQLNQGSHGSFSHSVVRYGGRSTSNGSLANIYNNGGTLLASESEISDGNSYGLRHNSGTTTVTESLVHKNTQYGVLNSSQKNIDARNNYWGHTSGPRHTSNPGGVGDAVSDRVLFDPWKTVYCIENCNSSVLFLPGIMGSHLYEGGEECLGVGEQRRWFSTTDCNQLRLQLDGTGHSINDIYSKTGDGSIVEQAELDLLVGSIPLQNLYVDFIEHMNELENQNQIADFTPFAYDWRLRLDELLYTTENIAGQVRYSPGISYKDGLIYTTLSEMAANSKNGKVTMVAHSNGGLLAKTFLKKLADENDPLLSKIDNLVLVAVPQVGTPDAVSGLLHGAEIGPGGLVVTQQTARTLLNNGPFGYHLLPNEYYFNGDGSSVATPAIVIDSGVATDGFRQQFGAELDSFAELRDFMGSRSGRVKPVAEDLRTPEVANDTLLTYAEDIGDALASWTPPSSMTVHQLGGVGIWTAKTLRYYSGTRCVQNNPYAGACSGYVPKIQYDIYHTQDGDETVVLPSALSMPESSNVKRWWVNLDTIAKLTRSEFVHKNIMEVDDVAGFVESVAKNTPFTSTFITGGAPSFEDEHQLVYELHSPLDMYIESREGRVSSTTQEVPGSFYRRYGEVQYVGVPVDTRDVTLRLNAYDSGSFTLVEEVWGEDDVEITKEYTAIPTATTSIFALSSGTTTLSVDFDGDGVEDGNVFEEKDIISVLTTKTEEETEEVDGEEVIEEVSKVSTSKQGSRSSKSVPVPKVAGASTSADIMRLQQMIYLLQEIIRLTLLLRQQI